MQAPPCSNGRRAWCHLASIPVTCWPLCFSSQSPSPGLQALIGTTLTRSSSSQALLVPALALSPRQRVNIVCAEPKYGVIYQFGRAAGDPEHMPPRAVSQVKSKNPRHCWRCFSQGMRYLPGNLSGLSPLAWLRVFGADIQGSGGRRQTCLQVNAGVQEEFS